MMTIALRLWCVTLALCVIPMVVIPMVVRADVVMDWNEKALASTTVAKQPTTVATRTMAIVHTAMFDAMNTIEARYSPYQVKVSAPAGSAVDAAGVAAAYTALRTLFPDQTTALDTAYQASLAHIAEGPGKASGVAVGEQVATAILAHRAADGIDAPNIYRPSTAPGVYIPTTLPVASSWGQVTPWVLERGAQFRPEGPPPLTSQEWARDYNETKDLGGKKSTRRTAEQTDIGRFWTVTGPPSWNPVVRQLAAAPGRTAIQNARLFALVAMATADAYIAVFDAKYTFNFWRPVTAIRNGDLDGNDATSREPGWEPLVDTPLHPEYPCAHCITSGAVAAVLEAEFGAGSLPAFTLTSPTTPGVIRTWTRIQEYIHEVAMARIYGGMHYRTSNMVGQAMGRKIGDVAVKNYLKPLR
jgi:PAP2 superfamily